MRLFLAGVLCEMYRGWLHACLGLGLSSFSSVSVFFFFPERWEGPHDGVKVSLVRHSAVKGHTRTLCWVFEAFKLLLKPQHLTTSGPLMPCHRGAALEEVAGVATFLASPLSSAVTGQTVFADCGFSAVV